MAVAVGLITRLLLLGLLEKQRRPGHRLGRELGGSTGGGGLLAKAGAFSERNPKRNNKKLAIVGTK